MPAVEPTDTISLPLPRAIVVALVPATVTSEDLAAVRSMMVSEAETVLAVLALIVTFLVVPAAVYRSITPSPAVTEA